MDGEYRNRCEGGQRHSNAVKAARALTFVRWRRELECVAQPLEYSQDRTFN
jgi:hypothetical protein